MRLHRLTISAFGPFAGTEQVDFDALSTAGLFLLGGPTGAGKTSVLDAVCFALYGSVPGVRDAAKSLHSDHAPRDREPRVELEVTLRGRRLRISRSPQWERPKKRGDGTVTENAKVILQEFGDGRWQPRSTRLDEAGQLIGDLVGMSAAQFCQVAMLPQGEFARFLRADAKERGRLLEKLFDTRIFTAVEQWLAERRRQANRLADERERAVLAVADRIAGVAEVGREEMPADALPDWAAGLTAAARRSRAVAGDEAAAAEKDLLATRQAYDAARELADKQRRHAAALADQAALEAHADDRAAARAVLDAALRADRVLPLLRVADERAGAAEQAAATALAGRAAVAGLVPDGAGDGALGAAERARRDEIAALEQLTGDAVRLQEVTDELAGLDEEVTGLDEEEAALAATLAELPGRRRALADALREIEARVAARPAAEAAAATARSRLTAAARRDALAGELTEAEDAYRAAVDEAQACRDRLQEIRQARLDGMAAELAGRLVEGRPCLVCGSPTHPAPAAAHDTVADEHAEEAATAADDAARAAREKAGNRLERLRAELAAATETSGDAEVADLEAELTAAVGALSAIEAAEADGARLADELRAAEAELESARDRREHVVRALEAARARREALIAEADGIRTRVDAARGEDPTLAARVDRIGREARLLAEAAEAVRAERVAAAEHATAVAEAHAAAVEEGFADGDAARDAIPDDRARAELSTLLRELDDKEASVRARLADPELALAAGEEAPDLAVLEARLHDAEEAHTAAVSARDRAAARLGRLTELSGELDRAVRAWRPAAETARITARLADLAAGNSADNRLRMRLSAYVLAARLEQVVAAANERLARMSSGRYLLKHSADKDAGDRTRSGGGLGLRVIDAWTGRQRDPGTLSGGETFVASLALALGLADVVTEEAGGAEIGTLFVDEGFGALDDETLDEVMDVLDGLRDGGRAVGVVSHIAELRGRIPAQLLVRKTRTGSAISVTGVGAA